MALPVIPAGQGKEGGLQVLKVDSFQLIWTEDEFTPNLGEPQAAPWERGSGDLLLAQFQLREVHPGGRGARGTILPVFLFCRWIFTPP